MKLPIGAPVSHGDLGRSLAASGNMVGSDAPWAGGNCGRPFAAGPRPLTPSASEKSRPRYVPTYSSHLRMHEWSAPANAAHHSFQGADAYDFPESHSVDGRNFVKLTFLDQYGDFRHGCATSWRRTCSKRHHDSTPMKAELCLWTGLFFPQQLLRLLSRRSAPSGRSASTLGKGWRTR